MSNEEPVLAVQQDGEEPRKLPEQAFIRPATVYRPFGVTDIIYQWQPMGIRVKIEVPFIGNDRTCLFLIRNGPFIPRWDTDVRTPYDTPGISDRSIAMFVFNNMRNVFLQVDGPTKEVPYPSGFGNSVTHYDYPPVLATLAQCFRKWRGTMQYRARVVSSFATQGYIMTAPIKQQHMPTGIYNEYAATPVLTSLDYSYKEMMLHAYQPSDISMFRHIEVSMPYDYPVPWYDQYQWIENRCLGANVDSPSIPPVDYTYRDFYPYMEEWCADNWIAFALRGEIASTSKGSVFFELEYRAGEDFQFSDPGLPPTEMTRPYAFLYRNAETPDWKKRKIIPSTQWKSNGVNMIQAVENVQSPLRRSTGLYPSLENLSINE